MKIVFPKLTPWQKDVYKDVTDQYGSRKRFVIKSGRRRGKSFLLCILIMEYAIKEIKFIQDLYMLKKMHFCSKIVNTF